MEPKRKVGRPKGSRNRPKLPLPAPVAPVRISAENARKAAEVFEILANVRHFHKAVDEMGSEPNGYEFRLTVSFGSYETNIPASFLLSGLRAFAERLAIEIRALGVEP